jgi:hypothetical protein
MLTVVFVLVCCLLEGSLLACLWVVGEELYSSYSKILAALWVLLCGGVISLFNYYVLLNIVDFLASR